MPRPARPIATLLLAANLLVAGPLMAGRDHDEIRRLRGAGQILSLESIIAQHRTRYPGANCWKRAWNPSTAAISTISNSWAMTAW